MKLLSVWGSTGLATVHNQRVISAQCTTVL